MTKNKMTKNLMLTGIASVIIFSGCASNKMTSNSTYDAAPSAMRSDYYEAEAAAEEGYFYDDVEIYPESEITGGQIETREEKIVKTGDMNILVGDFEGAVKELYSLTEDSGGYVENYNQYLNTHSGREYSYASVTLKIPADRYDEIKSVISQLGTVQSYSEYIDNITNQYYDTQSRLDMKKIERDRLLELLEQAESIEDIIAVEARLSQVNGDIDILEGYMTGMDRDVAYSTLYVYVEENPNESIQSVGSNLGSRIGDSFKASINFMISAAEDILLFIVFISVPLLITAVVLGTGILVYKKTKKKK